MIEVNSSEMHPAARLEDLYSDALVEIVEAILAELAKGRTPRRAKEPELRINDNGLPSLSDGSYFAPTGPAEYSDLLDPPYGDETARQRGKYPADLFPRLHALWAFVAANPDVAPGFKGSLPPDLRRIHIQLQLERAAEAHLHQFGQASPTRQSCNSVLRAAMRGLTAERLGVAVLAPIAVTRFGFDRLRLASNVLILKMSRGLQRARWDSKPYAGKGHDGVLSAATHAFVITGYQVENSGFLSLNDAMSTLAPEIRDELDLLFASLRLETGVDTGYAQEIRLARGWRTHARLDWPLVYSVGARRYPEAFDNFGWLREEVPVVSRDQMTRVAETYRAIHRFTEPRLRLALRRLNAAMMREDPADAILDATIALEILLGDGDPQAISWKLRMRAAALSGIGADRAAIEATRLAVARIYEARSIIVHGITRRKKTTLNKAVVAREAVEILRSMLKVIVLRPQYLDPAKIDQVLLLSPSPEN